MSGCEARFTLYGTKGVTAYCTEHGALATFDTVEAARERFDEHVAAETDDQGVQVRMRRVDDPRRIDHTMTVLETVLREAGPWMSDALYEAMGHALWALGKVRGDE